jgi:thymidine phosphorylase
METDEDFVRRALATWASGEACERFERIIRERNHLTSALEALMDLKNAPKKDRMQEHKSTT